jgi:hypothetical protein
MIQLSKILLDNLHGFSYIFGHPLSRTTNSKVVVVMTIQQAIRAKLRIEPGRRVRTFGGWCRRDRVLLDGYEIGKIQTRRAKNRTEIVTIAASGFVPGHNVDWLLSQSGEFPTKPAVSRLDKSRSFLDRRFAILRRSVG